VAVEHSASTQREGPQDFRQFLAAVARRPGMYVGSVSLKAVAHLFAGYSLACEHLGHPNPLRGWNRWLEVRFGIFHPAWHWARILLHEYGSEPSAIAALPELFEAFDQERKQIGVDGIEARHAREFKEVRDPPKSKTPDPFAEA
jgi:hypothetical protein